MSGYLGIALYHRTALAAVLDQVSAALLSMLGGGPELHIYLGDQDLGVATTPTLRGLDPKLPTTGPDRALTIADSNDSPRRFASIVSPQDVQPRALCPQRLAVLIPEEEFERTHFIRLCDALDARYGLVSVAPTREAALDEALWPAAGALQSKSDDRRHSNPWIQLMRSFGRHDLGVRVPDIYWGNVFGFQTINELRRTECWDLLEETVDLHYLESGGVAFFLSEKPTPPAQTQQRRDQIGDLVLAPLGSMWRPLEQARQGDGLLLDSLVGTGDARLALGLAFEEGIESFRKIMGSAADEVEDVAAALELLEQQRASRVRSYGESWASFSASSPALEALTDEVDAPTVAAETSDEASSAQPAPAVKASALERTPKPTGQPAVWSVDWLARNSLRVELATLSLAGADNGMMLDVTLVNTLPQSVELHALRAVHSSADGDLLGVWGGIRESVLQPLTGRVPVSIVVPTPTVGQHLRLQATVAWSNEVEVADLLIDGDSARIVSASDAQAHAWPATVNIALADNGLAITVTNTAHDPWREWWLSLNGNETNRRTAVRGLLEPGSSTWAHLSLEDFDGACQLTLHVSACGDVELADFETRIP